MISLTCTSCKKILEMDDAFAGGVCRCRFCGTIQTVPSKAKDRHGTRTKVGAKAIYAKTARGEAIPSSGLDQLAQVVASSGLMSERLRAETIAPASKPSNQRLLLLISAALLLVLGILIGAWFAMKSESSPSPQSGASGSGSPPSDNQSRGAANAVAPARVTAPHFCQIPLHENTIIYVLDRGNSTAAVFGQLKDATYKSIESLGTDKKYQIIFWNNGGQDDAYPAAPTFAMPHSIESARRTLDGVYAHGQSDVASALTQAVKTNPDVIILATGKGWQLDEAFIEQVMGIVQDKPIKIHGMTLGGEVQSEALKTISLKTKGTSRLVTEAELKKFGRGE